MARFALENGTPKGTCSTPPWWLVALVLGTAAAVTLTVVHRDDATSLLHRKMGSLRASLASLGGKPQEGLASDSASDAEDTPPEELQPPADGRVGGMEGKWGKRVGWPCAASGYCSLGKSKTWRGDVTTNEALKEMLEAVSYKKEIIYALSTLNDFMLEISLNVIKSAEALGYGHALILAPDAACCARIPASLNISCVWDLSPMVESGATFNFLYQKWAFLGRVVRMGYNALALDTDSMLAADVYSFVKQPPFADVNIMTQDDGGRINCGAVYIQNAHPSGPTAWLTAEHAYRTLRQREDEEGMRAVYPDWGFIDTADQPFWDIVVSSTTGGRPYYAPMNSGKTPKEWADAIAPYWLGSHLKSINAEFPEQWRWRTGVDNGAIMVIENLTLPLVGDPEGPAWWAANSKYIYPPKQGDASRQYLEKIRASVDAPFYELGQPWQPIELPQEKFAFLPPWFVIGYASRGVFGYWDMEYGPPAQVILHDMYMPNSWSDWKMYTFKGARLFNYDLLQAIHCHNVLGLPNPKLLMLAPGVELFTPTEQDFLESVTQLTRLATMMGRRLVVPHPPCDSMWVGIFKNNPHAFLPIRQHYYDGLQVLQFTDSMRPGNHTYCHWIRNMEQHCRDVTVTHADMVAYLERLEDRQQAEPGKQNTLWFDEWQAAGGAAIDRMAQPRAITTPQPEVSVADAQAVVRAAAAFAEWPVLFLGAVPKLESNASLVPLDKSFQECWLFKDPAPQLNPVGSAGDNRQRWLNGTLKP